MLVCFVSTDTFITHICQFNNLITAIHDDISHTKYLNTSYFFKILLKNSGRYGGTLTYI